MASSYRRTSSFADEIAAAVPGPTSTEGPPPPPPPPVPVPVALETEAVVLAVVAVIGEGVAEAETKLKEDAASRAAVDANKMLSILPLTFLFLLWLLVEADPVHAVLVVEAIINAAEGGR